MGFGCTVGKRNEIRLTVVMAADMVAAASELTV
jgi:hypothetical protein